MEVMEVRDLKMEYRTVKKEEGIRGSIRHLIKPRYGKKEAVKGVSFSIAQGESVAFLGANGAGKSTTIKMLTGILKPSGGEVSIMGKNPFCDRMENAKKIGINVDRDTILVYVICAVLAALGGILSAGQIGTIAATFGEGNEFIAISAAVVGGASLFGGKATILPGAVVGILLITLITNGMAMVNASPYAYTIVRGAIIFLAVMLDSINYKGVLR